MYRAENRGFDSNHLSLSAGAVGCRIASSFHPSLLNFHLDTDPNKRRFRTCVYISPDTVKPDALARPKRHPLNQPPFERGLTTANRINCPDQGRSDLRERENNNRNLHPVFFFFA